MPGLHEALQELAAVIAPPSRPATFFMSAMRDFSLCVIGVAHRHPPCPLALGLARP